VARDYKPRVAAPQRPAASPWRWLLAGLLLGTGLAGGMFYALTRVPEGPRPQWVEPDAMPAEAEAAETMVPPAAAVKVPENDPAGAAHAVPPPRFEFYQMLTTGETQVHEREIRGPVKSGVAQVEAPGTYVLQAGSFRTASQAEQQKARLALIGVAARIEAVRLQKSGEVVQRVQIGPYRNLDELNRTRARLKQNGFAVLLLKVKG
jgi:cell division protein FtsN